MNFKAFFFYKFLKEIIEKKYAQLVCLESTHTHLQNTKVLVERKSKAKREREKERECIKQRPLKSYRAKNNFICHKSLKKTFSHSFLFAIMARITFFKEANYFHTIVKK